MFKTLVKKEGKEFVVSTVDTFDAGWETLVFEKNGGYVATEVEYRHPGKTATEVFTIHERLVKEFAAGPMPSKREF